jgi:hypothetical protein
MTEADFDSLVRVRALQFLREDTSTLLGHRSRDCSEGEHRVEMRGSLTGLRGQVGI